MRNDEYFLSSFFYDWLVEPFLKPTKYSIAEIFESHSAGKVLDICCGTGTQCSLVAERKIRCFGIDISPGMLRTATRKKSRTAHFAMMDATKLALRNSVFDGIVISFALHEKDFEKRKAIADESKRVVKPGGTILVADYLVDPETGTADWKIRLVELLAGRRHFSCFKDYCSRGGLEGIKNLFDLSGEVRKTFRNASWGILVLTA